MSNAAQLFATYRVARSGQLSKVASTYLRGTEAAAADECARLEALNPGETWKPVACDTVPRGAHRAPGR